MTIGEILTDIGAGLTSIIPSLFGAIWEGFYTLFLTYTEAEGVVTVTGLNTLGAIVLAFVVLGICYRLIPVVTQFIGKRVAVARKNRAKKK